MGPLNIRQATHFPALAYISYTSHTLHNVWRTQGLSQTSQATLSPQLIPCIKPAFIRPQHWGGYIGPADMASAP